MFRVTYYIQTKRFYAFFYEKPTTEQARRTWETTFDASGATRPKGMGMQYVNV